MGFESFGNYEHPGNSEQQESLKHDLSFLSSNQNKIESDIRNYVLREQEDGRDISELTSDLSQLIERQKTENESLEKQIPFETKELLDKEALINEAKTEIYEKLGINDNQESNSAFENFSKGFVDEIILGNYNLAVEVINSGGKVIIEALKQLASWEGLKQIAQALGESIWNLFTGNAYEKGKAIAELGLVATGVGLTVAVGKKGVKLGMKQIAKLRVNKEKLVQSSEIKEIVSDTVGKVNEIVPKKELDFEAMIVEDIAKLGDIDRLEAGRFYLRKKDLTSLQEQAVLYAHKIGESRDGAGIYNYSDVEIRQKIEILKEAGFDINERRLLLENGVCARVSKDKLFQLEIKGGNLKEQVDYLYNLAEETRGSYDNLLEEIGIETGSIKILNSKEVPLKNKDNTLSKVETEYEGKYPEKVRDILRGSMVYDDIGDLKRGLQNFKNSDKITVIHVTDRLNNINTNDILLNIRFPNGFIGEVQLHVKETLRAKEFGYKLDKSIIDLDNTWSQADFDILDKLKTGELGGRILDKDIDLPESGNLVNGHKLYEIIRSLKSSNLTNAENKFLKKLVGVQKDLNLFAREQYEARTGKKFK